jgi:plastocyanin
VSEFLRLALPALLAASLGCTRSPPTAADGGRPGPPAAERPPPVAPNPTSATGSLEGRVLWVGPNPVLPPLSTSVSVQSVCGSEVADNTLRVNSAGEVAEVVVWVDAPASSIAGAQEVLLDQRGCLYQPAVLGARAGGTVRLRNSDPLTHTVHAVGAGKSLFNVAMPLEHMELVRPLPAEPTVVDIRCDVHPWMHATVRTFAHSHFTTTGADGRFRLVGLDPGELEVHAWHPRLGEASQRVKVAEGTTHTDFDFGGKP